MICPKCRGPVLAHHTYDWIVVCPKDGSDSADDVGDWNTTPKVVWLRSNHVSYTAEIPNIHLWPKGEISPAEGLRGFKWEPWP